MALEKQNITFPFVRGINEKPSERAQAQGELRSAHNITISKIGEFNKRVGFDEESFSDFDGGDTPSQLVDCAAHENELIVFDGEKAYSRYDTGKFKDRGTCVNTRLTQSVCNVDSASLDGPPAYCQIKDGTDNEVYEIFVWESRPFGVEDIERNTKSYPNTADTENYRNTPSKLLYSVRHKKTGVFLYDAEPITIDGKKYVDRDLLISSAGVTNYGVYTHSGDGAGEIRVEGYGSSPAIAGRTWADVVANGNQLILEGPFDATTGTSSKESMFFTDDTYTAVHADYVRVKKLSSSAVDNSGDIHPDGTSGMANVDAYINVDTGDNAFYFTTQPMLFSMTDNVVILTFASQYMKSSVGTWSIFQATFDFSTTASAIETPTLLTDRASGFLDLNYRFPIWDADLCYTTPYAGKKGITYIYNTTDGTNFTKLQFFEYDSSDKDLETTPISINVPRADGTTAGQQILEFGMGTAKNQFGGKSPSSWAQQAAPSRFVLKCVNQQSAGSQTNNTNNQIVFVFRAGDPDADIYVYSTKLSDSAFSAFNSADASIKPLLDRATGSQTWVVPPDLLTTTDIDGSIVSLPTGYDSSGDRFRANNLTVVNAAITNVKNISTDAIYLFVEVASSQGSNGSTWYDTTTSTDALNTYIRSEDRWIIRKNLANSSDTKVLGRNIYILSDAFYAYEGSKAYFAGHSVFDGDMSTARTCLFNEDGEVVGVYAPGQSALCHPYEMKQITANLQKYSNTPMFALRSRINSFSDEVFTPTKTGAAPGLADYPLPEFGISVIDNAERAYQYMAPFNPRLASITFFPERTFPSVQQQGTLLVGSGLLWAFNGGKFIENGFLQKPLIQEVKAGVASDFSSGGSAVAGASLGKYVVAAAYFYKDENGVSHYSPLDFYGDGSTIHEVTVSAASKKLVLQVSNTQITNKRTGITPQTIGYSGTASSVSNDIDMSHSSVSIAVFVSASLSETIENRDDLTDIPLQLYKMEPMDTNARFTTISIDSPNKTIQFKDQTTGASPLITSVPVQPSCPTDIAIHRNHVCVSTTDGFVYPSQSFESSLGSEGSSVCPMFAAANVISISEETNGVGASNIESDGQLLLAFNRNNVYAMGGDGPDPVNSGNAGTFSPPETIYLDQGIAVGGMAARIPAGVIYQSLHGYYLLSGKSLSFLGAPVEDFTADAYAVQVIDQTNEVVFATAIRSSSYSPTAMQFLVYNYEVNQWYTWLVPTDTATERATGMQGIVSSSGDRELFFSTSAGRVRRQKNSNSSGSTTNQYSDFSLYKPGEAGYYAVESKVKTGQIQIPDFFSGFRLYRIGIPIEIKTAAVLTIKLYYDGSSSAGETFSYTTAGSGYSEIILKPSTQKCRSIAIEIEEDPSSVSAAQGTVLNGIGLLAAPRIVKMAYNTAIAQVPTGS
tara:strand:- start:101 stop:4318 length:4218 start_codon:yes stop_codon:yes gene_type:complete